jgi:hypothetical protein
MNTPEVKKYIKERSYLFWWVPEDKKEELSLNSLVEAVLSFGNEEDVKKLFDLVGIETVANIFLEQISHRRVNYKRRTRHFFDLYFRRHVQSYSQ